MKAAARVEDCKAYKPVRWRHSHWCRKPQHHAGRHQCGSCRFAWNAGQRAIVVCLAQARSRRQGQAVPS